jgi:hypothetical protein
MRALKPCLRARFRRLGWNVRFISIVLQNAAVVPAGPGFAASPRPNLKPGLKLADKRGQLYLFCGMQTRVLQTIQFDMVKLSTAG